MAIFPNKVTTAGSVISMGRNRWKTFEKAEFLRRLGQLLLQGYTLSNGIDFLKYHQKDVIKAKLDQLSEKLRQGETFHEVLAEFDFPKDVLGYLYFSEKHGDLAFALTESGNMLVKREEVKIRFRKMLRYPLFLLWVVVILVIFMTRLLFPQFQRLYESLDLDFPWFTDWFLAMIDMVPLLFGVVIVIFAFGFLYYITRFRHLHPHAQFAHLIRIPLLRSFLPMVITQYFSAQISRLLKGGLSIFECLTVFEGQHHLAFFQQEASRMKRALKRGERLEDVIRDSLYYVDELAEVIAHGQKNGNLAEELFHYNNLLLDMIETKIKRWMTVVQPAIFAGIGGVVLIMFVSILLPIFNLMNAM